MAPTLLSFANVAGLVVATTCTFHHSGSPLLRVPTTWLCAGIGDVAQRHRVGAARERSGDRGQVDGRRMVDARRGRDALRRRRRAEQRNRNVERVAMGRVAERRSVRRAVRSRVGRWARTGLAARRSVRGDGRCRRSSSRCRTGRRSYRCRSRTTRPPDHRSERRSRSSRRADRSSSHYRRAAQDPAPQKRWDRQTHRTSSVAPPPPRTYLTPPRTGRRTRRTPHHRPDENVAEPHAYECPLSSGAPSRANP